MIEAVVADALAPLLAGEELDRPDDAGSNRPSPAVGWSGAQTKGKLSWVEAVLVTLTSVTLAAVAGGAWKLLDRIEASRQELNDKIDGVRRDVDGVRRDVGGVRRDLGLLSERVARIEGHLLGLEVPANTGD